MNCRWAFNQHIEKIFIYLYKKGWRSVCNISYFPESNNLKERLISCCSLCRKIKQLKPDETWDNHILLLCFNESLYACFLRTPATTCKRRKKNQDISNRRTDKQTVALIHLAKTEHCLPSNKCNFIITDSA